MTETKEERLARISGWSTEYLTDPRHKDNTIFNIKTMFKIMEEYEQEIAKLNVNLDHAHSLLSGLYH